MVRVFSESEWKRIAEIASASQELQQRLEGAGFEVINTLSIGSNYPCCITFIVRRGATDLIRTCVFDILCEEERVSKEIFDKGQALLQVDFRATEIEMLKKRLAELENE